MTATRRAALLGSGTSRTNKMHLAASWGIEWRWKESGKDGHRMEFLLDGEWRLAKSWEQDERPKIKWLADPKKKPATPAP
jgi:hypothetical protein